MHVPMTPVILQRRVRQVRARALPRAPWVVVGAVEATRGPQTVATHNRERSDERGVSFLTAHERAMPALNPKRNPRACQPHTSLAKHMVIAIRYTLQ